MSKRLLIFVSSFILLMSIVIWTFLNWFSIQYKVLQMYQDITGRKTVRYNGSSMEPALMNGQGVSIDTRFYKSQKPQRMDIILYESNSKEYIGRIVGLPGETIKL